MKVSRNFGASAKHLKWAVWLAAWLLMSSYFLQEEDPTAKPEPLSLWAGKARVGDGTFQTEDAQITLYRADHPNGVAMVICPGGGYGGLVLGPEGQGIALWLNQHGIA